MSILRTGVASVLPAGIGPSAVLAFAVGGLAGGLGRQLLGRLRRGVSVPSPWCELGVATTWSVAVARCAAGGQPWWWLPVPLAIAWLGVLLTIVDVRHRRLPDALTLPAYPVLGALL